MEILLESERKKHSDLLKEYEALKEVKAVCLYEKNIYVLEKRSKL